MCVCVCVCVCVYVCVCVCVGWRGSSKYVFIKENIGFPSFCIRTFPADSNSSVSRFWFPITVFICKAPIRNQEMYFPIITRKKET